jgi:hypothetical protein
MEQNKPDPQGELAFYEWIEQVLSIVNGFKLERAAGLPKDTIRDHENAVRLFRLQKDGEIDSELKLPNQHFAAVARAVMKATGGTIVVRWDTFQLRNEGVICIHGATDTRRKTTLHPLTDGEFNELF